MSKRLSGESPGIPASFRRGRPDFSNPLNSDWSPGSVFSRPTRTRLSNSLELMVRSHDEHLGLFGYFAHKRALVRSSFPPVVDRHEVWVDGSVQIFFGALQRRENIPI